MVGLIWRSEGHITPPTPSTPLPPSIKYQHWRVVPSLCPTINFTRPRLPHATLPMYVCKRLTTPRPNPANPLLLQLLSPYTSNALAPAWSAAISLALREILYYPAGRPYGGAIHRNTKCWMNLDALWESFLMQLFKKPFLSISWHILPLFTTYYQLLLPLSFLSIIKSWTVKSTKCRNRNLHTSYSDTNMYIHWIIYLHLK